MTRQYTPYGAGDTTYCTDDEVCDIGVIDVILPNIKTIVFLDIEQGFTALQIIKDLSWLWVHITDSSVNRWRRAINNAVKKQGGQYECL